MSLGRLKIFLPFKTLAFDRVVAKWACFWKAGSLFQILSSKIIKLSFLFPIGLFVCKDLWLKNGLLCRKVHWFFFHFYKKRKFIEREPKHSGYKTNLEYLLFQFLHKVRKSKAPFSLSLAVVATSSAARFGALTLPLVYSGFVGPHPIMAFGP